MMNVILSLHISILAVAQNLRDIPSLPQKNHK